VVAIVLGLIFLNEPISAKLAIGAVLIASGTWLIATI
jgi:uncharacterized membrane protein